VVPTFLRAPRAVRLVAAAAWLVAGAVTATTGGARAATPSGGAIDTSGTPVQWSFAPVVGTGVDPVLCPTPTCDKYALTVVLPTTDAATYYQSNTVKLSITLTWNNTVPTDLDLDAVSPSGTVYGPGNPDDFITGQENLTITDPQPGVWQVDSQAGAVVATPTAANAVAVMTASPGATGPVTASTSGPTFSNSASPPFGWTSGEPSVGPDWATGDVMYTGTGCINCNPFSARIHFDTSTSPPTATWTNVTPPQTSQVSLDPIGFMDHSGPTNDRWFMTELAGACSITAFTDNDGTTWTPSQGCGVPAGVDHETVGGGPYNPNAPGGPLTSYQDAVYYCSQDVATAFCARSDNGGLTFGPGVPVYSLTQCNGLHGHLKVGADGTVYLPNKDCYGHPSVVISHDNGLTWQIHQVTSLPSIGTGSDPSVGLGAKGTIYYGFQGYVNGDRHAYIAVSHDHGTTWKTYDVGAPVGIHNMEFAEVVAGDDNRAAFAFLGTAAPGDDQQASFPGVWDMYVATTSNGGYNWSVVDATPNDPVQRGCIWDQGGNNQCRNMLDFNDLQIDTSGRMYIAYTDGCSGACETDPNAPAADWLNGGSNFQGRYSSIASLLRQNSGQLLFSQKKTKR
jgi:hypothetical protein